MGFSALSISCSHQFQLRENEFLLADIDFKGNTDVYSEELSDLIPLSQKANSKPLNLPFVQFTPRVWFYNFGLNNFKPYAQEQKLQAYQNELELLPKEFSGDNKLERKKQKLNRKILRVKDNLALQNSWFWRNIGEKQTIASAEGISQTEAIFERYLKDIGYREAQVSHRVDTLLTSEKFKLVYLIKEGPGYVIDTVNYAISDPALDSLIEAHDEDKFIKAGDLFDFRKVRMEKARLAQLAKENGYYNFLEQYIKAEAYNADYDFAEFERKKRGNLQFTIQNPPSREKHQKYTLNEVIFKAYDAFNDANTPIDTTNVNGVKYITLNKKLNERLLDKKVISRPGSLYNINDITDTQQQISLLNQFSFASSQITPISDKQANLEYYAPQLPKYSFSTGPGLNHVYNSGSSFLGFGIPVTLTARNWFKRLELFEASGRIFREGQPSPLNTNTVRGSWEIGTNFSVTYPNISFFGHDIEKLKFKNPRTQFSAGFNYSEPYWGNRLDFKISNNYRWQPKPFTTIFFSLIDVNLVNTNYNTNEAGQQFYNSLVEQQARGNNIKTTFDPQFVSSFNATYLYNDQDLQDPYGSSRFLRVYVESGGTLLNLAKNKEQIGFIEKLFPLRTDFNSPDTVRKYFRYVKANVDYRQYINLSPSSSLAYRVNVGVANPYGNKSLPYVKNFFVGGSNSVRAWSPRSLGVGSAQPDTAQNNIIPQTGDILIEGSVEVRKKVARFFGDIQLALFLDFGNIWKYYPIYTEEKQNKANFDFSRFYKEFAVGTGAGLRYDLTYFQFRFDWGIKVVDPSRSAGDRFVLDEFKLKRNYKYGLNFNLGIGYPF
ncbi:outer membrane protein assembly factor [Marinilongibacter aquaticus]|uniref:translocation and assembly module lipoprotein TamL n=1 Tax=Marinilongibacter aquaticus TaxID=2975157 RepID=UPI0021BD0790|nr:outer membrane protein assembly factor [Marinilongibacter aquaticus]UBM58596.1 outer membrane protein assembly factor [Marinilongibacter aquaticus]